MASVGNIYRLGWRRLAIYIGWVGVGWQRSCKTRRSLRELDNQGSHRFFSLFFPGGRVRGMVGSRSVCAKALTKKLRRSLIATSGSSHTRKKTDEFIRRCHLYARKSASQAFLSRMQLTLQATRQTPHGALRLVLYRDVYLVGRNP